MRYFFATIFLFIILSFSAMAYDIAEDIKKEARASEWQELVPESLSEDEVLGGLEFSYSEAFDTLAPETVADKIFNLFFKGFKEEMGFVLACLSFLVLIGVYKAFSSSFSNVALKESVNFVISLFLCIMLYSHIIDSLKIATLYISELSNFMKSLLPIMATLMCMQGGTAEAVTSSAVIIVALILIQSVCTKLVIPIAKLLFGLVTAGFISHVNFSGFTETFTSIAAKTCTISMSIMSAILYFKNALASASDGLALRGIKLAAGNFIPVVGGMVSESAATMLSAVRVVKSTLGVFAFAVLLYMTLVPIIAFLIKKLSLRILSAVSGVLGCDEASSIFKSVYGIYHILSSLMISSGVFFAIAVGLFVKNGVV